MHNWMNRMRERHSKSRTCTAYLRCIQCHVNHKTLDAPKISRRIHQKVQPNYPRTHDWLTNLHAVDVVAVVAYQPGELDLADLVELLQSEGRGPAAVLVPEAVAEPEVVELLSDDAGEGGADHGAGQGQLGDAGRPHVDVIHAGVSPARRQIPQSKNNYMS